MRGDNDLWVLEYSVEQDCTHIETWSEMLERNLRSSIARKRTSYILIGMVDTHDKVVELAEKFRSAQRDFHINKQITDALDGA